MAADWPKSDEAGGGPPPPPAGSAPKKDEASGGMCCWCGCSCSRAGGCELKKSEAPAASAAPVALDLEPTEIAQAHSAAKAPAAQPNLNSLGKCGVQPLSAGLSSRSSPPL